MFGSLSLTLLESFKAGLGNEMSEDGRILISEWLGSKLKFLAKKKEFLLVSARCELKKKEKFKNKQKTPI